MVILKFTKSLVSVLFFSVLVGISLGLNSCSPKNGENPQASLPINKGLKTKMAFKGMEESSPIMMRIFKQESELEVWKETKSGKYGLLGTYEICAWSGELGPKYREGDRQAPEGFYSVNKYLMNPYSNYHLAFNLGFPNKYDRSKNRTGSHLMVHGECTSRGCYAMENKPIESIYALAREALKGEQTAFQVQAFPFHMTAENLAPHYESEHLEFWKNLKEGYDHFNITRKPPKVDVCGGQYVFNATPTNPNQSFSAHNACPDYTIPQEIETALIKQLKRDNRVFSNKVAALKQKEKYTLLALAETERQRELEAQNQLEPLIELEPGKSLEENLIVDPLKSLVGFFGNLFTSNSASAQTAIDSQQVDQQSFGLSGNSASPKIKPNS